ncbi:MAG: TIGR00180 family glycosyltransferase [Candidatus Omnitrophica bacterium]|nr:TIGR00180 family glycosyltransferase [Candidatus Omnitrophota bacterium]
MEPKLTLLLPTENRSDFFARAVRYYRSLGLDCPFFVADSSSSECASRNEGMLQETSQGSFPIEYRRFPEQIPFMEKIDRMLEQVRTPFIVVGADDDFFVPGALRDSLRFLSGHPDYSGVSGEALLFRLESDQPYGRFSWIDPYPQKSVEMPTASSRLSTHFFDYTTTWYSVQRTEALRHRIRRAAALPLTNRLLELLTSGLTVVEGKFKKLDRLFLVRQSHSRMTSQSPADQMDLFDWLTDSQWPEQYRLFQDCLAQALAKAEKLSLEEARPLIKKAFQRWLSLSLRKASARLDRLDAARDAGWAARMPALSAVWKEIRPWIPRLIHSDFFFVLQTIRRGDEPAKSN